MPMHTEVLVTYNSHIKFLICTNQKVFWTGIVSVQISCNTKSYLQNLPPELFYEKAVLKPSQNLQENTCVGVSFLAKVQAWRPAALLKKRLQHRCFPKNIVKFLRPPILKNICEPLLLYLKHLINGNNYNTKTNWF